MWSFINLELTFKMQQIEFSQAVVNINKQMFVKHLPPARSEYRVPQRPITKTGTKEGQLTQRYY